MRRPYAAPATRILAALIAVCGTLGSCAAPRTHERTPDQPAVGQITPLLASTLSTPRWFTGTDRRAHLVYELTLANAVPAPVTLNTIEVRDADSDATLISLSGAHLRSATSPAASADTPTVQLPSSSVAIVWLDVPLPTDSVPAKITHRISIDPPAEVPLPTADLSFTGEPVAVDRRPPVAISPPLVGPRWLALGSCCDGPHRRALYPIDGRWYLAQRFAIDFNQLDEQNRPGVGEPLLPNTFPSFGQPVIASADGIVAAAVDGNPDLAVNAAHDDPTPADAGGNRIAINIGDGRFAQYAHLRQGSISVRAGEHVSRGQHIADVGSSGTSGGPHLHFQVSDRPSLVFADGLPFVFESFDLSGQTPPLADVLKNYDTLEPIPVASTNTGHRNDEMPLGRDVMSFPVVTGGG